MTITHLGPTGRDDCPITNVDYDAWCAEMAEWLLCRNSNNVCTVIEAAYADYVRPTIFIVRVHGNYAYVTVVPPKNDAYTVHFVHAWRRAE